MMPPAPTRITVPHGVPGPAASTSASRRYMLSRPGVSEDQGEAHYLWRAVDQAGNVLDILVQNRRNKAADKKLLARGAIQTSHYEP